MAAIAASSNACLGIRRSSARPAHLISARKQCMVVRCQAAQVEAEVQTQTPTINMVPGKVCLFDAPQFDQLTAAAGKRLVVVDVYTQWCGPCKMIAPELDKMAEDMPEVLISKIDCTSKPENKKWAMAQNVKALPTFILFKEGKRVNDMTGAKAANLRKLIEAHI